MELELNFPLLGCRRSLKWINWRGSLRIHVKKNPVLEPILVNNLHGNCQRRDRRSDYKFLNIIQNCKEVNFYNISSSKNIPNICLLFDSSSSLICKSFIFFKLSIPEEISQHQKRMWLNIRSGSWWRTRFRWTWFRAGP